MVCPLEYGVSVNLYFRCRACRTGSARPPPGPLRPPVTITAAVRATRVDFQACRRRELRSRTMPLIWVDTARQRARARLAAARSGPMPPPFTAGPDLGEAGS